MKKVLFPFVLLAILFASCKKKDSSVSTTNTNNFKTYTSMDEVYALLALQAKVVTFDAQAGASFYGNGGTRYIFSKNSFIYANGDTVTGNVQIEVTEWFKKGDMIFDGMLPISNGESIVSSGEFNVKATKDGKQLFLRNGYYLRVNVPRFGSTDKNMSLFRGITNGGTPTNKVNWQLTPADTATIPYIDTSIHTYTGIVPRAIHTFQDTVRTIIDSFGGWNCDHFVQGYGILHTCSVNITASGHENSALSIPNTYALYQPENLLVHLNATKANNVFYGLLPTTPFYFVSFGLIDGHFYGGVTAAISPKQDSTYNIQLTEVDPKDFKAQINGLY
ncbi:MAG: hypothetical protein JWQ38_248 [Flavipsychrobacter sp.]|nr:hypothetical protein [Flavipsychrobacter sp.]